MECGIQGGSGTKSKTTTKILATREVNIWKCFLEILMKVLIFGQILDNHQDTRHKGDQYLEMFANFYTWKNIGAHENQYLPPRVSSPIRFHVAGQNFLLGFLKMGSFELFWECRGVSVKVQEP